MSKGLKWLFLVHAVVALVFGAALLLAPGRFEAWLKWQGSDIIISRLLGAALLGMAWASFRGWQATEWSQVAIYVEMGVVFDGLASAALLRHLVAGFATKPIIWAMFALFLVLVAAWVVVLAPRMRNR